MSKKPTYEELEQRVKKLERTDVERKQAEEALRESEERFKDLANLLPQPVWETDLEGNFKYANRAGYESFDYTPKDLEEGLSVADVVAPEDRERAVANFGKTLRGIEFENHEYTCLTNGGRKFPALIYSSPIIKDGEPSGVRGVTLDITARKKAEAALKEAYDIICRSPAVAFLWKNEESWPVEFVTDNVEALFGYTTDEFLSRRIVYDNVVYPDDLERVAREVAKFSEEPGRERFVHHPYRILTKKGQVKWVEDRTFIRRDEKGHITHYQGIVEDITERKQVEEALRESEEKFRLVTETINDVFWMSTCGIGEMIYISPAYETLWERSRESLLQSPKSFLEAIHPDDLDEYLGVVDKYHMNGKPYKCDYRIIRIDGEVRWIHEKGYPVPDSVGGTQFMSGVCSDITDRKQAEEALRLERDRAQGYLDTVEAIIVALDREGRITLINQKGCRLFGYNEDDLIGQHWFSKCLPQPEGMENVYPYFLRLMTGEIEVSKHFENPIITRNGELRQIAWHSTLLRDEQGHIVATLSAGDDITERKQLESQLQQAHKMESIGTLAGGIAHDFNNILGIILGNIELAMDDMPEWNPTRFNLEEIRTASLRAKDVVRQLLSFARKTKLEKKPTNIIPIVTESLQLLRSSIPTSIEIRHNIQKDVHTILADPTQINQVLINLCTNAYHAMQDGGIFEVSLKNVELDEDTTTQHPNLNPGRYVNLSVSDTGHGMSSEEINRIFDPYFTTKEVGKGTGMGLAVVHGIVTEHNGIIIVESEPEKETTFNIFFPITEREPIPEIQIDEDLPTVKERILFIDDEQSMVDAGQYRLERLGYQVETKTNPVEALKLFRANPDQFDLVITDMTMPQMTGDHLVEEILKIRPDLPTIICTGFSENIDEEKAKEIGIRQYIEKPFSRSDLAKVVRKALNKTKEEQITGHVLVIEDEPQMRTMLKQMIEDIGCDVVKASDGKEGVKLYRANPFDLIVTDIIMPEKEGIETIIELKRDFPDVKIIAVSGGGEIDAETYLSMAKKLGARYTFAKPISREELLKAIRQLLG